MFGPWSEAGFVRGTMCSGVPTLIVMASSRQEAEALADAGRAGAAAAGMGEI